MADLTIATTADLPVPVLVAVRRLLDDAFAADDDEGFTDDDWAHALGGWHVVATEGDVVVGHASVVPRHLEVDGRPFRAGYVEAVATHPRRQGLGIGTAVMAELDAVLTAEAELGALSTDRSGFYERLGWERWQGPTFARHGTVDVRTAEEDDGILVRRFGPSAEVDLTASILCEGRSGDDW